MDAFCEKPCWIRLLGETECRGTLVGFAWHTRAIYANRAKLYGSK